MHWCLHKVLSTLKTLATKAPNAQVFNLLVLSILHLMILQLKFFMHWWDPSNLSVWPRFSCLALFLPGVTTLISLLLITLPHQIFCLHGNLSTCTRWSIGKGLRLVTMGIVTQTSNIHMLLIHVTTFIVGSIIGVVTCISSFIALQTHFVLKTAM